MTNLLLTFIKQNLLYINIFAVYIIEDKLDCICSNSLLQHKGVEGPQNARLLILAYM